MSSVKCWDIPVKTLERKCSLLHGKIKSSFKWQN